jgi:hypothetical protein
MSRGELSESTYGMLSSRLIEAMLSRMIDDATTHHRIISHALLS